MLDHVLTSDELASSKHLEVTNVHSLSVFQERSRGSLAGLLPHAAECAGLQLSAVSAQSSPATRRSPAGELQQQTAQSEEPAGGADPGGSLLTQMSLLLNTLVWRLRSNIFKHCCCIPNDFLQTLSFFFSLLILFCCHGFYIVKKKKKSKAFVDFNKILDHSWTKKEIQFQLFEINNFPPLFCEICSNFFCFFVSYL